MLMGVDWEDVLTKFLINEFRGKNIENQKIYMKRHGIPADGS